MLTIATFKWGDKYTARHVDLLFNMLERNLTIPWQPALITDRPEEDYQAFEGWGTRQMRIIPLWDDMRDTSLCGVRLRAFGADMAQRIAPRFAWVDLDVVITGNVDHIFGRQESFIALATTQGPLAYNGSLVMMDAGARPWVYTAWNAADYEALRPYYAERRMNAGGVSDEGWMTKILGTEEAKFNGGWKRREDGIYYFRRDLMEGRKPLPADARMVVMNGKRFDPAFSELQKRCPWIKEHWR